MCPCSTSPPKWTVLPFLPRPHPPSPHPLFLKTSGIHFSILFLRSSNPMEEVISPVSPSVLYTSPDGGRWLEDWEFWRLLQELWVKAPRMCSVKWVVCPSVETVEGMPHVAQTPLLWVVVGLPVCTERRKGGFHLPQRKLSLAYQGCLTTPRPHPPPPQVTGARGQTVAIIMSRVYSQQADSS